jgi:hypothetical protein
MAGTLKINPMPFTLRQLVTMYDAALLHDWDQTTLLATHLANIPIVLNNMFSKQRLRPHTFLGIHPLRRAKPTGTRITKQNFHMLKGLVDGERGSKVSR